MRGESFGETEHKGGEPVPLWWWNSHEQEEAQHVPLAPISACGGSFRRAREIISEAQDKEKQRRPGLCRSMFF